MNTEQEELIRFIFSNIRQLRKELTILYQEKEKLEILSDQFYISYMDSLWIKSHIQLLRVYEKILEKYTSLKNYELQIMNNIIKNT